MELLYSITTAIMSIFTFTREPVVGDECTAKFIKELKWCEVRKNGEPRRDRCFYRFSRFSEKKAREQLEDCREIQRRITFNDRARLAYSQEGVYMANQRNRDRERKEIRHAERQNVRARKELEKESDDDEERWASAKKQYHKGLYADHKQARRRARSESPDPSDAELSEHGSVESASEEEAPPPRRRRSRERRRAPQQTTNRTPAMQEEIQDAIEFLRGFGIETVTPNGGKCP